MDLGVGRKRAAAGLLALAVMLAACDPTIVLGERESVVDASSSVGEENASPVSPLVDAAPDAASEASSSSSFDAGAEASSSAEADAGPTLLWFSDHETRDLSAWHAGGDAMGGEYEGFGTTAVSSERAHSGSYAAKFTIDTSDGTDHTARAYRRTAPGGAYYSAWFYLNETHSSFSWWTFFLFRALTDPQNIESAVNLWDIGLERRPNGDLALLFFDHMTLADVSAPADNVVPVGQWFHLEAYFEYAPPQSTHITLWQDGRQVMDLKNLGAASSDHLYWAIGNGANGMAPPVSVIYADDAAIATMRLGPNR
jgi:hypothetical protein